MQIGLAVGVRQEGEEFGDALVFLGRLAAHHPQRSAADDGILRRALHVGEIRHRHRGVGELGVRLDVRIERRGGHEHRTFARSEAAFAGVGAPRIIEALVLLQLDEVFEQLGFQRGVEFEHGVEAIEPVGLGADRHVMPGGKLLDQTPGNPRTRRSRRSGLLHAASWRRRTLPARSSAARRCRPSSGRRD